MPNSVRQQQIARSQWPFYLSSAIALVAFLSVGHVFLSDFALDLGSLNLPTPRYVLFTAFWALFGAGSAALLGLGITRQLRDGTVFDNLARHWNAVSERRFLFWTSTAALIIPASVRLFVLHGAPLADDESAYRFAAELLASGRLWVPSPPLKLFFDQNFMINDGRLYPVYFLGWPALLAMGEWLRLTALTNPLLSAITVPPLFWTLRRFAGSPWAKVGIVLFLGAPFIQIAAATQLSHTSCLMALSWCLYMYLRTREDWNARRYQAGFAFFFGLAFFIRPQSAVGVGLPMLIAWALSVRNNGIRANSRAIIAFLVPAVALGALFLSALHAQNGSPWRVGYARYAQYLVANHFRFSTFKPQDLTAVAGFDFSEVVPAVARAAAGIFRLNFDLFGWPSSFALLLFALPRVDRNTRILWGILASFMLLMLFQRDWGIDTFGPVHAFELALPVLLLTIIGARNLGRFLTAAAGPPGRVVFAPALVGSLIVTAWVGFVPVRLEAVRRIAEHVNQALRAPERAGLHRAAIFAPLPFAPPCGGVPRHFVFFRPTNDPGLRNDILWVNQLDLESDRRLLETLPNRTGYLMQWTRDCQIVLEPLATVDSLGPQPARH